MELFCVFNKLDKKSLQDINDDYSKSYNIDLDELPLKYEKIIKKNEEDIKNSEKKELENTDDNPYIQIEYKKKFYGYFKKLEGIYKELDKANLYNDINKDVNNVFGLDIINDCIDNNKTSNEDEQLKTLKEMYGIDLSFAKKVESINKRLYELNTEFMGIIKKIINRHADSINSSYRAIYTAMYYYYGKELLSIEDKSKTLKGLEELINNKYDHYIRIDAASIEADIPSSNQEDEFGFIWDNLLHDKRGNQRDLYSYIMQGILINNKESYQKADI